MALKDHLSADTIDALVPCRKFFIRAQVTEDRQLPVVDEFALRLIRVAGRISTSRLRRFFGFKETELQAVLLGLTRSSLVTVDGEEALLTSAGQELFTTADANGVPRLTDVENWENSVWFDLVSRNMMRGTKYRPDQNLISLPEDRSARQLPETFAREAFETNFRDFAERVVRHPNADKLGIYAVTDVLPAGFGYQTVTADVHFTLRNEVQFGLDFPSFREEPLRFHKLTSSVANEWSRLQYPEPSANGVATYERLTGDDRPAKLVATKRLQDWAPLLQSGARKGARPIFGAPYLPHNAAAICAVLFDRLKTAGKPATEVELVWFRPGGNAWGRTRRLVDTVGEIKTALRGSEYSLSSTTLIVPRSTPNASRRTSRKQFDRGVLAPSGQLPADLEVILIPGIAACATIYLPLGERYLAIGSVVTEPEHLRRIEGRISRERQDSTVLWGPAKEQHVED